MISTLATLAIIGGALTMAATNVKLYLRAIEDEATPYTTPVLIGGAIAVKILDGIGSWLLIITGIVAGIRGLLLYFGIPY